MSGSWRRAIPGRATRVTLFSAGLVALSALFCVAAVVAGRRERDDITFYVLPHDGRGHPGVVGAATAIGLAVVAVATLLASVAVPRSQRRLWMAGSCLFASLATVQLTGLHEVIPGVDVVVRPLLWILLVVFVMHVRRSASVATGGAWMAAGVALFAISELIDLYPSGDDRGFRYYRWTSVFEECALSVGAWCTAAGAVGAAVMIIRGAIDGGTAMASAPLEPAPLERQPEG